MADQVIPYAFMVSESHRLAALLSDCIPVPMAMGDILRFTDGVNVIAYIETQQILWAKNPHDLVRFSILYCRRNQEAARPVGKIINKEFL